MRTSFDGSSVTLQKLPQAFLAAVRASLQWLRGFPVYRSDFADGLRESPGPKEQTEEMPRTFAPMSRIDLTKGRFKVKVDNVWRRYLLETV